MTRKILISAALVALVAMPMSAQPVTSAPGGDSEVGSFVPSFVPANVLVQQAPDFLIEALTSQEFSDFPDFGNEIADNFQLPANCDWFISDTFFWRTDANGLPPTPGAEVEYYLDAGATPGGSISPFPGVPTDAFAGTNIEMGMPTAFSAVNGTAAPITLWLSAKIVAGFADWGQEFVNGSQTNLLAPASVWQNPGDGFGTGCTTWGDTATCLAQPAPFNLAFALVGTSSGTGPNCQTILPVELSRFEARANDGAITLEWETQSETNNAGFYVERVDGQYAEVMAFVEGNGTTTDVSTYSQRIDGLDPGAHKFRLRQVDFDGTTDYSETLEVLLTVPEGYMITAAYPNPFNPTTSIQIGVETEQNVSVDVYDLGGRLVETVHSGVIAANQLVTVRMELSNLPSGLYVVSVKGRDWIDNQTISLVK